MRNRPVQSQRRWTPVVLGALVVAWSAATGPAAAHPVGTAGSLHQVDSPSRAGYSSAHRTVTQMTAGFTVPTVDCESTPDGGATIVIGFDSRGHTTPYRFGYALSCRHGRASYSGWYKLPDRPRADCYRDPVPGERIRTGLDAIGTVDMTSTACGSIYTGQHADELVTASTEVQAQADPDGGTHPLADFGTVYFWAVEVNQEPIGAGDVVDRRMVGDSGSVLALASPLHDDGSFAVNWRGSR